MTRTSAEELIFTVEDAGVPWCDDEINLVDGSVINGGTPSMSHIQVALEASGEAADGGVGEVPAVWVFNRSWDTYILPACRQEAQPGAVLRLRGIPVITAAAVSRDRFYLLSARPDLTVAVVNLDPLAVGAAGYSIEAPFQSRSSLALASPSEPFRDACADKLEQLHGAGCSWTEIASGLLAWLAKDETHDDNDD